MEAHQYGEWYRRFTFFLLLLAYLCESANTNIVAALFPPYALDMGLNETEIGFATGVMDISSFIAQLFLASAITPKSRKMFYTTGLFCSGMCVITFGFSGNETKPRAFFIECTLIRALLGVGKAFVTACTVPLVSKLYPEQAGIVTSIAQTCLGLGGMIGGPLGSVLSSVGTAFGLNGYTVPFYLFGSFQLTMFLCALVMIPSNDKDIDVPKPKKAISKNEYYRFIGHKNLLITSSAVVSMLAVSGFKDVAYSPYFENQIGVPIPYLGFVFLGITIPYMCISPLWGYLVHNGNVRYIMWIGLPLGFLAPFLFFLPYLFPALYNLPYSLGILMMDGALFSSFFSASHIVFEKIAEYNGFENTEMNKLMAAGWFNATRALGRVCGSFLIGGVLLQQLQFNKTCLVHAALNLVVGSIALRELYKMGMFKKMYYTMPGEEDEEKGILVPEGVDPTKAVK